MNTSLPQGVRPSHAVPRATHSADLELALFAQSIAEATFEDAVRKAVALVGGAVLFILPATAIDDCSRVAAVSLGGPDERQILLVMLGEDGLTTRIENAADTSSTIADMASSYAGLMERIQPLAS